MENELILKKEKAYMHQETKELLEEVRSFFQGKLKMIGIEWVSDKKNNKVAENGMCLFVIEKANIFLQKAVTKSQKILTSNDLRYIIGI